MKPFNCFMKLSHLSWKVIYMCTSCAGTYLIASRKFKALSTTIHLNKSPFLPFLGECIRHLWGFPWRGTGIALMQMPITMLAEIKSASSGCALANKEECHACTNCCDWVPLPNEKKFVCLVYFLHALPAQTNKPHLYYCALPCVPILFTALHCSCLVYASIGCR